MARVFRRKWLSKIHRFTVSQPVFGITDLRLAEMPYFGAENGDFRPIV